MDQNHTPVTVRKLVDNAILTLIARAAIVIATLVGLPAAGWMLNRAVAAIDKVTDKVDAVQRQNYENGLTINAIKTTQEINSRAIADHEVRVRFLERGSRQN